MRIHLIAVGTRMDDWVNSAYEEYARRLPPSCALRLIEVPAGKATKNSLVERRIAAEGERQLAVIPANAHVVILDERGREWDTRQCAGRLERWLADGRDVALLVGGADGLAAACRERAEESWSLSRLTLPHPLVRVIVAEQLYRAWSLLNHHPYHRA
ncbi:MAG: 23S rRNA (pseudouridine(1915)-N(3))-methyltransferase RlmH [Proteobacteria bacterium]|nr:MAG: 23S rRNA (pseudouridine(1915)-N(3))-methyltransferase RlmH [Pseudomonadota bacterium]QKK11415.1 MAG: 23S rRNA (pseudouridine(1915)-N(3))-methyltransferase RlmH [Pseudomonadota bacterium]